VPHPIVEGPLQAPPALSIIIPADRSTTVAEVVEHVRAQTISERLELVLFTATPESLAFDDEALAGLGGVTVVEVPALVPLSDARATAVRAARAPFVFLGETHSLRDPGFGEALLAAHAEGWPCVVPVLTNANPTGRLSWASFLSDYGANAEPATSGEVERVPCYNASFDRELLLRFLDEPDVLRPGGPLAASLSAAGVRFYRAADAHLAHVNVARSRHWARERYLSGRLFGAMRAGRWSVKRRTVYVLGAPLIPVALLAGMWPALRLSERRGVPSVTLPAIVFGALCRSVGEVVGYARGYGRSDFEMTEYELRKRLYA
jgi:hypothetical protein